MTELLPPYSLEGTVWINDLCDLEEPPLTYLCGICGLTHRAKVSPNENGLKGTLEFPMEYCMCGAKAGLQHSEWQVLALPGVDLNRLRGTRKP